MLRVSLDELEWYHVTYESAVNMDGGYPGVIDAIARTAWEAKQDVRQRGGAAIHVTGCYRQGPARKYYEQQVGEIPEEWEEKGVPYIPPVL